MPALNVLPDRPVSVTVLSRFWTWAPAGSVFESWLKLNQLRDAVVTGGATVICGPHVRVV